MAPCPLLFVLLSALLLSCPTKAANVSVRIGSLSCPSCPQISENFLGLSLEWLSIEQLTSSPVFTNLVGALTANSPPGFVIRIGGGSEDVISVVPSPLLFQRLAALHQALGVRYILGVRLKGVPVEFSKAEVAAALEYLPPESILAVEIGNEPNHYPGNFSVSEYKANFTAVLTAIQPLLPTPLRQGISAPAWAGLDIPPSLVTDFIDPLKQNLSLIIAHYYAGNGRKNYTYASLLNASLSVPGARALHDLVQEAARYKLPVRVDEMNSLSDGGRANVSNTLAAALWSTQVCFQFAAAGASGVNFHGAPAAPYDPINATVDLVTGNVTVTAETNFYGLLLFQRAVQNATELLSVSTLSGGVSSNDTSKVQIWAVGPGDGRFARVVILNLDERTSCNVTVQLPSNVTVKEATVAQLVGPSAAATSMVTFAGQSFNTSTGLPIGRSTEAPVNITKDGSLSTTSPPASGLLLTITFK